MQKHIYLLSGLVVTVFVFMAFLHSTTSASLRKKSGFTRKFLPSHPRKITVKHFTHSITDIAGITPGYIYLTTHEPDKLLVTNTNTGEEKVVPLRIAPNTKLQSNFTTTLSYPNLYIAGSNVPCIVQYNLDTKQSSTYKIDRAFSRSVMIAPHTAIVRGFNAAYKDENIRKVDLRSGTYEEENGITDKTEGGGFVTDGLLNFDAATNRIVYNHFYSNKVVVFDTSLRILYQGSTIDTFHSYTAKATMKKTDKGAMFSFSAPPRLLSYYSYANNGRLFIYSNVKADNERGYAFGNNDVIDIYDLQTVQYTGSFYIPAQKGKNLIRFKVFDDLLIALYDKMIVLYRIQL